MGSAFLGMLWFWEDMFEEKVVSISQVTAVNLVNLGGLMGHGSEWRTPGVRLVAAMRVQVTPISHGWLPAHGIRRQCNNRGKVRAH